MRLNVAAKRGTDAAQELNKVDGDDSPNHVNEGSAAGWKGWGIA